PSRRDERRNAAARRSLLARRLQPLEQEIERIEQRLEAVSARMAAIDSRLGESDAWDDPDAANALTRERTLLQREQDGLEEHWL
ncbi:ABC transporter C-terminal domain-containing protein, partial [Streptococcus pyogenes]